MLSPYFRTHSRKLKAIYYGPIVPCFSPCRVHHKPDGHEGRDHIKTGPTARDYLQCVRFTTERMIGKFSLEGYLR